MITTCGLVSFSPFPKFEHQAELTSNQILELQRAVGQWVVPVCPGQRHGPNTCADSLSAPKCFDSIPYQTRHDSDEDSKVGTSHTPGHSRSNGVCNMVRASNPAAQYTQCCKEYRREYACGQGLLSRQPKSYQAAASCIIVYRKAAGRPIDHIVETTPCPAGSIRITTFIVL